MNKLQVLFIALLVTLIGVFTGSAQNRNQGNGPQRARIDAQKVAFITDQLQLTPDEAQKFWPVYNQLNSQKEELNRDFMEANQKVRKNVDTMSDKDASDLADSYIKHAQKVVDLQKEFHSKLKDVLPPKKLLKLYNVERDFQRLLLQRLGERKPGGRQQQQ
jgi:Spy/CpxP family protein refolding chaperone